METVNDQELRRLAEQGRQYLSLMLGLLQADPARLQALLRSIAENPDLPGLPPVDKATATLAEPQKGQPTTTAPKDAVMDGLGLSAVGPMPWDNADPNVKVPFQARFPQRLHRKLVYLNEHLPGGPSIQELLLRGTEELADRLIAELRK